MGNAKHKAPPRMRQRLLASILPFGLLPLAMFGAWSLYLHATDAATKALVSEHLLMTALIEVLDQEVDAQLAMLEVTRAGAKAPPSDLTSALIWTPLKSGYEVSSFLNENETTPIYFVRGGGLGNQEVRFALPQFSNAIRQAAKDSDRFLALLPDAAGGSPVPLAGKASGELWTMLAEIRSVASGGEHTVGGVVHQIAFVQSAFLPVRIASVRSMATIRDVSTMLTGYFIAAVCTALIGLIASILIFMRRVEEPLAAVKRAADGWAAGDLSSRAGSKGTAFHAEMDTLVNAFDAMADSMRGTQLKTRVLYKSTTELFHCTDLDSVVRKAVELACTQCGAEVAWFDPLETKGDKQQEENRKVGPWMWKQHRLHERTSRELVGVWQRKDGDRVFSFRLKGQAAEVGVLRAAYGVAPDELTSTLLHSLAGLVDMAVAKFDQGMRGAMLQTEVEMAEAVRRDLIESSKKPEQGGRVAFHYQPAQRFGGDWFHLIEADNGNVLYAIIGDVTGHGLVQGMITTAVKGALDVIEGLLKRNVDALGSPAMVISLIDTVVRRVANRHALAMTCVAVRIDFRTLEVRICNAGHTFPILVREDQGVAVAMHLHKEQQSMLGMEDSALPFREAVYQMKPRDLLVLYTDGLTGARSLKSEVFGKFLFRSLRRRRDIGSAASLRDEILEMFKYYTQNQQVDDDVCFLVTQMLPVERQSKSRDVTPAA